MGVATAAASAVSGVVSTVGGIKGMVEGKKMQREAQNAIDNFKWQELNNPYEDLQVSTLGADLKREELARGQATNVEALRGAGTRGLVGGLGRVQEMTNQGNLEVAADLDRQRKDINKMVAQDETRIRDMVENRQTNELAGYGQQLQVGREQYATGFKDLGAGLSSTVGGIMGINEGIGKGLLQAKTGGLVGGGSPAPTGNFGLEDYSKRG